MREFLKAPLLVLHFSYYTLMTFLMMLSVILLSMLMILLSILSVIGHTICGNNLNWLLNLNQIYGRTSECVAYWKYDHNLTVTKFKCISNKFTNYRKWKWLVVLENMRLYIIIEVIYCYFGRENYLLKFRVNFMWMNNSSSFEISTSLF